MEILEDIGRAVRDADKGKRNSILSMQSTNRNIHKKLLSLLIGIFLYVNHIYYDEHHWRDQTWGSSFENLSPERTAMYRRPHSCSLPLPRWSNLASLPRGRHHTPCYAKDKSRYYRIISWLHQAIYRDWCYGCYCITHRTSSTLMYGAKSHGLLDSTLWAPVKRFPQASINKDGLDRSADWSAPNDIQFKHQKKE